MKKLLFSTNISLYFENNTSNSYNRRRIVTDLSNGAIFNNLE